MKRLAFLFDQLLMGEIIVRVGKRKNMRNTSRARARTQPNRMRLSLGTQIRTLEARALSGV